MLFLRHLTQPVDVLPMGRQKILVLTKGLLLSSMIANAGCRRRNNVSNRITTQAHQSALVEQTLEAYNYLSPTMQAPGRTMS